MNRSVITGTESPPCRRRADRIFDRRQPESNFLSPISVYTTKAHQIVFFHCRDFGKIGNSIQGDSVSSILEEDQDG